ncbi:MAG: DUF6171 family protein [Lachnospiraceae bacterium]|nr:DUF6171 family protein [Lachnospiraceae bacterium]
MDNRRYCRKCLMQDMGGQEQFFADLKSYIEAIAPEDRTPEASYAERLRRCRECDYLEQGMCRACGCYVELRAARRMQHCSYNHW